MLTCPNCCHSFETSTTSNSNTTTTVATTTTSSVVHHNNCNNSTPCLRVFSDSGGGIVLESPLEKHLSTTTVQFSFTQDPSPSIQLSLVLPIEPWTPAPPAPIYQNISTNIDLQQLTIIKRTLKTSGWYYEGLSWQDSTTILDTSAIGTFLIRDSSDPRFLFSLSVQTSRGPTSVRLHYINGKFRLDAEERLIRYVPTFDCVLKLVDYYVKISKKKSLLSSSSSSSHVLVDLQGQLHSNILFIKPKLKTVPTLQHLARISINHKLKPNVDVTTLNLPTTLHSYLKEYPYLQ